MVTDEYEEHGYYDTCTQLKPVVNVSDDDVEDVNFDFDDDDDNDNLNVSLFTSHHRALVTVDNRELFRRKLDESKTTQNHELRLNGKFVDHLPEELKLFTWVTIMTIETTDIKQLTDNLPPNLTKLVCRYNNMRILDCSVLPDSVISLTYQNNNTTEIVGLKDSILELDISNNMLRELSCMLPANIVRLCVSNNKLFQFNQLFPDSLKELVANDTCIKSIDDFNDNLEKLSTCRCHIPVVKKFPANLKEWKNFVSRTEEIQCEFPHGMTHLDMFNNQLVKCPTLPDTMMDVDLSSNNLMEIPEFFPTMTKIDLKQNKNLKAEDLQTLQKEMPGVNIMYDSFKQNIYSNTDDEWATDYDYYGYQRPTYVHNNGNYYQNNNYKPQTTWVWKPEFDTDTDPDVVVLNKTYIL